MVRGPRTFFRLISHVQENPQMALCSLDSYSDVLQILTEAQMGAETLRYLRKRRWELKLSFFFFSESKES
jgi:hypothetical protein